MHIDSVKGLGSVLVMAVIFAVFIVLGAVSSKLNPPPIGIKPSGLTILEAQENAAHNRLLDDIRLRNIVLPEDPLPRSTDAPLPSETKLYRDLTDNLLNSLHYYFILDSNAPPSEFVNSWLANDGSRLTTEARLMSLEYNVNYLLSLEIYRSLHAKAIFDEDLEYTRARVDAIFAEEWSTRFEWPLGVYFDLIDLYNFTGDEKYLEYAERYGVGGGPLDSNTPLFMAKQIGHRFQFQSPRQASPFYFYYAAFLADYGNRYDPTLLNTARELFNGLQDLLYDPRFKLLYKQVSVATSGSEDRNIIQTFSTLEQLTAIRGILRYWEASGDPEALSLARAVMNGVWGSDSVLSQKAPQEYSETTFFGLYTAYDHQREATRFDPGEITFIHILLFQEIVELNAATKGEYRGDIDFLKNWLESSGPVYSQDGNGYYSSFDEGWVYQSDSQWLSSKAAIWMTRALVEDELYRFRRAQEVSPGSLGL